MIKPTHRLLIIDDTIEIYNDFKKILLPANKLSQDSTRLLAIESELYGHKAKIHNNIVPDIDIHHASQGLEAVDMVKKSIIQNHPYSLAFVDVRMPPGLDGINTIKMIREIDKDIQIVICTAYSDYNLLDILNILGNDADFLILKKPFDVDEIRQLTYTLFKKWKSVVNKSQNDNMISDLKKAILSNEFLIYYQPQIDVINKKIIATEALVRWNHPSKGIIMPDQFIPIAIESGQITDIDNMVLRQSCHQLKEFHELPGLEPFRMSVNITSHQLIDDAYVDTVKKILLESNISPEYLEIELTESSLIAGDHVCNALQTLRDMGVTISIDDFGAGYSNLSYLNNIPFDRIKIDKAFIKKINHETNSKILAKSIIDIATKYQKQIVAEGVETENQVKFLFANGCPIMQGYYFCKPIPKNELITFMTKNTGKPVTVEF